MNMVKTIILVVIAVVLIVFVLAFIRKTFGTSETSEDSKMSSIIENIFKGKDTETAAESEMETIDDVEVDTELQEGLNTDKNGRTVFMKNGSLVKDCWLDYEKSLYRFDADGYAVTGEYPEDAYIYTFSQSGKLQSIRRNESYTDPNADAEYPSLVETGGYKIWLTKESETGEDMWGRFRAIKYKKSATHYLGSETNKQYTLPGTLQTDGEGYVYWLPLVEDPDELESLINGTLYRMKPGDEKRQIVADDVEGYRVVTTDSGAYIYYFKNGSLGRCGSANCRVDETVTDFTEDMEYQAVIRNDKLYLQTASGVTVTKAFDSFTTGGFTYRIAADGEILSVAENKETALGEYIYSIMTDQAFGRIRNAVIRKNESGKLEMISNEFEGECRNIFGNEADGRVYGEYTYLDNAPHIIVITKDGDVDMLMDTEIGAEKIELYTFGKDSVFVKNTFTDGTVKFQEISVKETTPIALGTDPVDVTDMKPGTESETVNEMEHLGPGYADPSVGQAPDGSVYNAGPGALPTPTAEIPDQPVVVNR